MAEKTVLRILLLEDDPDHAEIFRRYAARSERYRIKVTHVTTPEQALHQLSEGQYDVLFIDQRLGEAVTGLDVLKQIRAMGPEPPVIILTGMGDEQLAVEMMKSGATDYLLKDTFNREILERAIHYALAQHASAVERKLLEIQLMQAQKLEAIGRLAAGIAHEINTPTQFVGDNTRFLQESFSDLLRLLEKYGRLLAVAKSGAVPPELIEEIESLAQGADVEHLTDEIPKAIRQSLEGIERVAKIVHAMREFSHPGPVERTPSDINKAIESTITVSRNEWKYVAEMVTDLAPDLPPVLCIPAYFNEVILNLIVNAAQALAGVVGDGSNGKGRITVRTLRDGDWAEVRIADTGPGIPEEVRTRIFDPFVTTKEAGNGTGQGLAIARAIIVEKHGGAITFETESGKGTTFIVRLPLSDNSPQLEET